MAVPARKITPQHPPLFDPKEANAVVKASPTKAPSLPPVRQRSADLERRIRDLLLSGCAGEIARSTTSGWSRVSRPSDPAKAFRLFSALPAWRDLVGLEIELEAAVIADVESATGIILAVLRGRPDFRINDGEHVAYASALAVEVGSIAVSRRWSTQIIELGARWASNRSRFRPQVVEVVDACGEAHEFLGSARIRARLLAELLEELENFLILEGLLEENTDDDWMNGVMK